MESNIELADGAEAQEKALTVLIHPEGDHSNVERLFMCRLRDWTQCSLPALGVVNIGTGLLAVIPITEPTHR